MVWVRHVDDDPVAVGHQGDRAAVHRLGGHVADAEPVGAAREPPVGDQGAVRPPPHALHGPGDRQHLAHARAALRALVADDHHGVRLDRPGQDRLHGPVLAVEDPGRAVEGQLVDAGHLDHRALRGQRAGEHGDAALGVDGVGQGVDHVAVGGRRGRARPGSRPWSAR